MHRALITGVGHRQGIGYAIASRLAEIGFSVVVTRWGKFELSRQHSRDTSAQWPAIEADLEDPLSAEMIFNEATADGRIVDVLILNHAFFESGDISNVTAESLDVHLKVNVRGSVLLCQEFIKRNPTGWGRIIILTSGQSLHPMPLELAYAASKGALEAISLALAGGLASSGITVNAMDPGGTDTDWISKSDLATWIANSPRGRVGTPIDAANLVCFLAGEEAGWITGQLIRSRGSA